MGAGVPVRTGAVFTVLLPALLALAGCAAAPPRPGPPPGLPESVELSATPFHPQTVHQCGPAALATVLGAAGAGIAPDVLADEVYLPGRQGSLQAEMAAAVRARGLLAYEAGPTLEDLYAQLAAGTPVLVLQRLGAGPWPGWHYAVLVGYDSRSDTVILRSGKKERLQADAARFEATWARGGRWALAVLQPGDLPARADVDRYLRAAAALETGPEPQAASRAYEAATVRWPGEPMPWLGLGNVAAGQGDWAQAERAFRTALELDRSSAAALNNRAESLRQLGCTEAALAALGTGWATIAQDDPLRPVLEQTRREIEAVPAGLPAAGCARFAAH
jgi:tetratricopeptide (TPR) repeat protein